MGVKIPEYRLTAAKDLPNLRKMLKGGGRHQSLSEELSLTSMIDMFSVIILFLIQSFSATGEVFLVNEKIQLPPAAHAQTLQRAPLVTVMMDKIVLEGAPVGENADIKEKIEETDWDLPLLARRLEDYKAFFENIHPGVKFPGDVILQADKEIPFVYVKRVMYSLVKIGFVNVNLAVRGEANVESKPRDDAAPAAPTTPPGRSGFRHVHPKSTAAR